MISKYSYNGFTRSRRGFPRRVTGASQHVCDTCEVSNCNAERQTASKKDYRGCLIYGNLYD